MKPASDDILCCFDCEYQLRDLNENRCPECGRRFDPDDSSTMIVISRNEPAAHIDRQTLSISIVATPVLLFVVGASFTLLPHPTSQIIGGLAVLFTIPWAWIVLMVSFKRVSVAH